MRTAPRISWNTVTDQGLEREVDGWDSNGWAAACLFVDDGMGDLHDFIDSYIDTYDVWSDEDALHRYLEDSGLWDLILDGTTDTQRLYFDHNAYVRDLLMGGEYTVSDTGAGRAVFRNI